MVGVLRLLQLDALLIAAIVLVAIVLALARVPGVVPIALTILVATRRRVTGPRILGGVLRRRRVIRRRGGRHPAGSVHWLSADFPTAARVAAVHKCVSRSALRQAGEVTGNVQEAAEGDEDEEDRQASENPSAPPVP